MSQPSRPIRVNVYYSTEAHSFWANSPDLRGLAASGKTREEVKQEARYAAETIFEVKGLAGEPELTFQDVEFHAE